MLLLMYRLLKTLLLTMTLLAIGNGIDIVINKRWFGHRFNLIPIANAQENAQAYDQEKIESYAKAILEIEPLRQETYQEIQEILDTETVPDISCDREESFQDLPSKARSRIVDYCNQSREIVENHGLSVSEFNELTQQLQEDSKLKQQVEEQLLKQQSD